MPELPEVETVTRLIRPRLVGRRIEGARVSWARTLGGMTPGRFRRQVVGSVVKRVWRRGKYIVIDLEPRACIVGHLRMTGRMQVGGDPGPYTRVSLPLDDGSTFHFVDVRKFGRLVLAARPEDILPALGPEPLGEEFTAAWLRRELKRRRML